MKNKGLCPFNNMCECNTNCIMYNEYHDYCIIHESLLSVSEIPISEIQENILCIQEELEKIKESVIS